MTYNKNWGIIYIRFGNCQWLKPMENYISARAESYKSAIKCCGAEETSSVDSKDSMLEAGEYVERLSFWQRPKQKVDLEFIDVSYSVKQGRKGEPSIFMPCTIKRLLASPFQNISKLQVFGEL